MRILKKFFFGILILFLIFVSCFFIGKPPQVEKILWGVNFSQKHAELLGTNWQEIYLALLDDLKVKNIKLITHWDLLEPNKDDYRFNNLDWQLKEAQKRNVKIILVTGMKTGRWPECHIPNWAKNLTKKEQQKEILELLEIIVLRYKEHSSINFWQVENEPFFPFGECPWKDIDFLKKEISLVKSLDPKRPIIISDSGEFSFWIKAAQLGDIVGITLYRKTWMTPFRSLPFPKRIRELGIYISYPFQPIYYWRKTQIIRRFFDKKVINVELQAEPWGPSLLYDSPLKEQEKTMNLERFKRNIEFAKKTGLDAFYFWGAEWWYWLKEKQNQPEIWEEAKKLF